MWLIFHMSPIYVTAYETILKVYIFLTLRALLLQLNKRYFHSFLALRSFYRITRARFLRIWLFSLFYLLSYKILRMWTIDVIGVWRALIVWQLHRYCFLYDFPNEFPLIHWNENIVRLRHLWTTNVDVFFVLKYATWIIQTI